MGSQFIGADIGLTFIKAGRFDESGELLSKAQTQLPQPSMPGAVTVDLCELIQSIDIACEAGFVGVLVKGDVDPKGRTVRTCVYFPGWTDVPLADWLEPRLRRKVVLCKDNDCALLEEGRNSESSSLDDSFLLTLLAARSASDKFSSLIVFP